MSKKIISLLLAVVLALGALPFAASGLTGGEALAGSDVPVDAIKLQSVKWLYNTGSTNLTRLSYYEPDVEPPVHAEYYYAPCPGHDFEYAYATEPEAMRDLCTYTVTSSDRRVIQVHEETKRLLVAGNGLADLTITATAPDGTVKSDAITVIVTDSPYQPITDIQFGYDPTTEPDRSVSYASDTNTLSLGFAKSFTLTVKGYGIDPKTNLKTPADLLQEDEYVQLLNGESVCLSSSALVKWTSSDPERIRVDADGKITAVGIGRADITVTVLDNGVELNNTIHVRSRSNPSVWIVILNYLLMFRVSKAIKLLLDYLADITFPGCFPSVGL